MRETEQLMRGAQSSLTVEAFRLADRRIVGAIGDRAADQVDVRILADPEEWAMGRLSRDVLEPKGATFTRFGDEPDKLHSKAAVADHERAVITTSAWVDAMRDGWVDLSVFFGGDAARALESLTKATMTADKGAIQRAAVTAAAHGVLLNDVANDVYILRDQLVRMIDGASESVTIVTKRYADPAIDAAVTRARGRGLPVHVEQRSKPWHANMVIADGQAYVGTGHMSKRSMSGGGSSGRRSREIGVLVDDPATIARLRGIARPERRSVPTGALVAGGGGAALLAGGGTVWALQRDR